jgi:MinD-like ATPase involved in chromosome partitioning or flagellar assembly
MYMVTFYSYKGGVGRTMALVNTAFELTKRGRRVLIVDFDLEAPGISTYAVFDTTSRNEGIVDYISKYIATGEAPDVRNYIVRCSSESNGAAPIWVMPAGKRDRAYGSKLAAIDWQRLYSEHEGFLMFDDVKQQWSNIDPKLDYVLIDSRTGHTDVGGICTRQLPSAVMLMFYPNRQNIVGLSSVVEEIRSQSAETERKIELLFCPSNVPDLDDEEEILQHQLDYAAETLNYVKPASVIHHYDSLDLLNQVIFKKIDQKQDYPENIVIFPSQ